MENQVNINRFNEASGHSFVPKRDFRMNSDPISEFRKVLIQAGLRPDKILADGKLRRCSTDDKPQSDNGWYVLFKGPPYAGAFGDWARGLQEKWCMSRNGERIESETWHRIQARIEEEKKAREDEKTLKHLNAAKEAHKIIETLPEASPETPYLKRKGIKPCPGLKADNEILVVPIFGPENVIMSLQRISPDGDKKFLPCGQTKGGFIVIQGNNQIVVCEGLATGLSIHESNGATVFCAFSAGNLLSVSQMVRKRYPEQKIIIAADNDMKTEDETGKNTGLRAAICAAQEVDGLVVSPDIDGDFNDLHQKEGIEVVRTCCSHPKEPLQFEIDIISERGLDSMDLPNALLPVKKQLSKMPLDKREGYFDYMKKKLGFKTDFLKALRQEIKSINKEENEEELVYPTTSALFPRLIDLVKVNGHVAFLILNANNSFVVCTSFEDDRGRKLVPPEHEAIPFSILPAEKVLAHKEDNDSELYYAVLSLLQKVSVLPTMEHYHLCTVFIFFTYISDSSAYYPYIWFFGLPERGKSRIVKAMCSLCYRGLYTETLNEAYIFRFADLFRGTLALDLYEISERAQKKGSHDLLLGRYEQGMKVARVIAPDKGPFRDTAYFSVSGATILASNVEISAKDPLRGRCIKITMPEARGIYPNNNSYTDLEDLKSRLVAFRGRQMERELPVVEKPIAGRLGDIVHPLLCVARLLPKEAEQSIRKLIQDFEVDRRETESESLAGKIAQALYDLKDEVVKGRLPVDKVREKINEGIDERYHNAPQTIGRELSAMGIKRKKSDGKMQIIYDTSVIDKIYERFGLAQGNLPDLPDLPMPEQPMDSERDIINSNLPTLPENLPGAYYDMDSSGKEGSREDREIQKDNLPDGKPCQSTDREIREEREIFSQVDHKKFTVDEEWGII